MTDTPNDDDLSHTARLRQSWEASIERLTEQRHDAMRDAQRTMIVNLCTTLGWSQPAHDDFDAWEKALAHIGDLMRRPADGTSMVRDLETRRAAHTYALADRVRHVNSHAPSVEGTIVEIINGPGMAAPEYRVQWDSDPRTTRHAAKYLLPAPAREQTDDELSEPEDDDRCDGDHMGPCTANDPPCDLYYVDPWAFTWVCAARRGHQTDHPMQKANLGDETPPAPVFLRDLMHKQADRLLHDWRKGEPTPGVMTFRTEPDTIGDMIRREGGDPDDITARLVALARMPMPDPDCRTTDARHGKTERPDLDVHVFVDQYDGSGRCQTCKATRSDPVHAAPETNRGRTPWAEPGSTWLVDPASPPHVAPDRPRSPRWPRDPHAPVTPPGTPVEALPGAQGDRDHLIGHDQAFAAVQFALQMVDLGEKLDGCEIVARARHALGMDT